MSRDEERGCGTLSTSHNGPERGVELVGMACPDVLHLEPKCWVGFCGYA